MNEEPRVISASLALGGTLITILVTGWAMLYAESRATGGALVDMCSALAVIWGTKYAADNLSQLKEEERERQRPHLYPEWRLHLRDGDARFDLHIRNHGEGNAIGVEMIATQRAAYDAKAIRLSSGLSDNVIVAKQAVVTDVSVLKFRTVDLITRVEIRYASPRGERFAYAWEYPYLEFDFVPVAERKAI